MMQPAAVGLIASRIGYEERRILEAAHRAGVTVDRIDPRDRVFTDADPGSHLAYLNREISSDRALFVARNLESVDALVMNSAAAHQTAADKWATHLVLAGAGLPVARTVAIASAQMLAQVADQMPPAWVLKHRRGSWGRNVVRAETLDAAESAYALLAQLPSSGSDIVLVQEYVAATADLRVIVVDGEVLGVIERQGSEWRHNVALGSRAVRRTLDRAVLDVSRHAARVLGLDICGIDLLERADGSHVILEANARVEFRGFESVHGHMVAEALVDLCQRRSRRGRAA